jgi:hypothetical protein
LRYLQGERYQDFAEELGETIRRVERAMKQHGVISKEDTSTHYREIMAKRVEKGVRVGRKSDAMKKAEREKN